MMSAAAASPATAGDGSWQEHVARNVRGAGKAVAQLGERRWPTSFLGTMLVASAGTGFYVGVQTSTSICKDVMHVAQQGPRCPPCKHGAASAAAGEHAGEAARGKGPAAKQRAGRAEVAQGEVKAKPKHFGRDLDGLPPVAGVCVANGFLDTQAPRQPPCPKRPPGRPLIIVVGDSAAGATAVSVSIAKLGFVSATWESVWFCDARADVPITLDGMCKKKPGISPKLSQEWADLKNGLGDLNRSQYPHTDWCTPFRNYDAIGDVPVHQLFPYIYTAHRKAGVKVVMAVRNATAAPKKIKDKAKTEDVSGGMPENALAPLSWLFLDRVYDGYKRPSPLSLESVATGGGVEGGAGTSAMWAYLAEVAMVGCMVPPEDLLLMDVLAEPDDQKWARLAKFLGKPVANANVKTLGRFWHA